MKRSMRLPGGKAAAMLVAALAGLLLSACEQSRLPPGADVGPQPTLPEPVPSRTVNVAPAQPWPEGQLPKPAPGLVLTEFARDLRHPRWVTVLPNGDVLVAESNAPEGKPSGIKGWIMKQVMKRAGAGNRSANRITLLRDADGDGRAEVRHAFLENLHSPFGMVLVDDRLVVANTDALIEFPYTPGQTRLELASGRRLAELPAGERNHHWTKNVIASPDGTRLFVTVGSNSNVAENGIAEEEGRAAVWVVDRTSGAKRLFATGLRNPNGMAFTQDGVLWTVVNERDELGSDLVPDFLTSVRDGGFYGWPWSYFGRHVDTRVDPPRPDLVQRALVPEYALGAHVAPLGLAAVAHGPLTAAMGVGGAASAASGVGAASSASGASEASSTSGSSVANGAAAPTAGMFVGLHGSWNRRPPSGYKVIFVPFADEKPQGKPIDVLTGFLSPQSEAWGRPVGVAIDTRGALLVADDVGNAIWRVAPR